MTETVKIKIVREGARMPERKTKGAAGYDLYTPEDVTVKHGRTLIPLGFAMQLPQGWVATIRPRSGFSLCGMTKYGVWADVLAGTIDEDYRGEVGAIVRNSGNDYFLPKGTRIAQMVFQRYEAPLLLFDELDATERAAGGYGSTGETDNNL